MKEKIIKFIESKKTSDFVDISALMAELAGGKNEAAKNLLKQMQADGLIEVGGDLYKVGSTQGGQIPNYKGEMVDATIEYDFNNVKIIARLKEKELA